MRMLSAIAAFSMLLNANASAQAMSAADKMEIAEIVIKHFKENPEELVEAILDWREKGKETIPTALTVPISGNINGDVAIYEFQDYGCAPCRQMGIVLDQAAIHDGGIMIYHHDFPFSGQDSINASLDMISIYAASGDYKSARSVLLTEGVSQEARDNALRSSGVDGEVLDRTRAAETLKENRNLAKEVGLKELPAMIVAHKNRLYPISGTTTAAELLARIDSIREDAR